MKRLTAFFLSLILIFSLTACGGNSKSGKQTDNSNSSTEITIDGISSSSDETGKSDPTNETEQDNTEDTDKNAAASFDIENEGHSAEQSSEQPSESQKPSNRENNSQSPSNKPQPDNNTKEPEPVKPSNNQTQKPADSEPSKPEETKPQNPTTDTSQKPEPSNQQEPVTHEPTKPQEPVIPEPQKTNILVVYFSATGTTKPLAEYAADILNADIYEIKAQVPYTDADLAYYTGGRADKEQNDPSARPAISGSVSGMEDYDTIILGYPIWHGQAIREAINEGIIRREDVFVITKIYPGSEMANPEDSIQACLDRLDIGYVDMMLLHHPDRNDVKAYKTIEQFVSDGKIRSIGLSNWYVKELTEFLPQVNIIPALVQNEIHPYYQENNVIPFIQEKGIVVQGWYPLGGRGHTAELLSDSTISSIAKAHGVSSAQVILRWNLQKGVVVIPGSSNPDHIKENTELYHFTLTEDEMNCINALDRNEKHDWY